MRFDETWDMIDGTANPMVRTTAWLRLRLKDWSFPWLRLHQRPSKTTTSQYDFVYDDCGQVK